MAASEKADQELLHHFALAHDRQANGLAQSRHAFELRRHLCFGDGLVHAVVQGGQAVRA